MVAASGVYPRVCGGSAPGGGGVPAGLGLSPRVRGKHDYGDDQRWGGGSIPACAGEARERRSDPAGREVYPRVCGGSPAFTSTKPARAGLSPRVRGKPHINRGAPLGGGSIPACAGEAWAYVSFNDADTVYPRVCGGSYVPSTAGLIVQGLSPRVRGKPTAPNSPPTRCGSIPACAGEARHRRWPPSRCRVYPRVCGGSMTSTSAFTSHSGLSPRVRGKRGGAAIRRCGRGSIPACAGEADKTMCFRGFQKVYPRVCGGSYQQAERTKLDGGLSPRVRGKHRRRAAQGAPAGSIPACAGEANRKGAPRAQCEVYPRVCGGSETARPYGRAVGGLSPRVQGKQCGVNLSRGYKGSIPACAGEAVSPFARVSRQPVYPRVCGGSEGFTGFECVICGLSPRVRGKLAPSWWQGAPARSIPACAGEAVA